MSVSGGSSDLLYPNRCGTVGKVSLAGVLMAFTHVLHDAIGRAAIC